MDNKPKRNPAVERYAARVNQPKIPDLRMAHAMHDPAKDSAMPIAQIGKQLEGASSTFLRPETLSGLQEMKRMTDTHEPPKKAAPVSPPEPPQAAPPPPAAPAAERAAETRAEAALMSADDLEYERLLRLATQDIINNDEERKAVEKRVKDFDFDACILNNEFIQDVEITKGLTVTFRSVSPMEGQSIKVVLREHIAKYPRIADLEPELYNFMYMVAAVAAVNGRREESHLVGNSFASTFDEALFMKRYEAFRRRPTPLIHALIVHAA
jgi:hypothetical protein